MWGSSMAEQLSINYRIACVVLMSALCAILSFPFEVEPVEGLSCDGSSLLWSINRAASNILVKFCEN